jgi:hypothetical protein
LAKPSAKKGWDLRTVARLGVDKFISHVSLPHICEVLMNLPTLCAWKRKKKIALFFWEEGDILTLP